MTTLHFYFSMLFFFVVRLLFLRVGVANDSWIGVAQCKQLDHK